MTFAEAVATLAVSCFLLGLIVGFSAKYFWDHYCTKIEEDADNIECEEDADENEDYED